MTILIALSLVLGLSLALIWGLMSVFRDLLERYCQSEPVFHEPGPIFHDQEASTGRSNLNLPGNLDHVFGRKIESIDHLHGIAVEKRKQLQAPAGESGVSFLVHDQISGPHEHRLIEIDRRLESMDLLEGPSQVRDFEESKTRNHLPQAVSHLIHDGASRAVDTRRVLEDDAERNGVPGQHAHEMGMCHDQTGYFLRASGQEYRGAVHPGNCPALESG